MREMLGFAFILIVMIAAGAAAWGISQRKAGRSTKSPAPAAKKHARIPVILDTDIGDDIDDTWALAMLLGSREVDLRLIVTGTNDPTEKARLVAKILERSGRTGVPLGIGIKTATGPTNQAKWVGDTDLKNYKGKIHSDGIQALIDCIHAAETSVTLCAIGPLANLAEALRRDPSIAKKTRLVCMAGSVFIGYNAKPERDIEYNIVANIPAARAVLAAPWLSVTWAPLDSCGALRIKGERYARLAASKAPRAAAVIENYEAWTGRKDYPKGESSILFDTVAVYLCLAEEHCEMKTVKLKIDDKGFTVPDEKGHPVRCALKLKNQEALEELIEKALTDE